MRLRAHILAFLAALAFVASSGALHAHADGPSLDKNCAVCAAHSHASALAPDSLLAPGFVPALVFACVFPAPLSGDARPRGATAPRGPPAAV
jgi:hypothetical protein